MEKKTIIFIGVGSALLLAGGIYAMTRTKIPKEEDVKVPEPDPGSGAPANNESFPMKKGMRGSKVATLQKALRDKFGAVNVVADGSFGEKTLQGVVNAGYTVPLTEQDYNRILEGVKKVNATNIGSSGGIKTGDTVYAKANGIAAYTKPVADLPYMKTNFKIYDKVGVYIGLSSVKGWSKVYLGAYGDLFVPTGGLTNVKP